VGQENPEKSVWATMWKWFLETGHVVRLDGERVVNRLLNGKPGRGEGGGDPV